MTMGVTLCAANHPLQALTSVHFFSAHLSPPSTYNPYRAPAKLPPKGISHEIPGASRYPSIPLIGSSCCKTFEAIPVGGRQWRDYPSTPRPQLGIMLAAAPHWSSPTAGCTSPSFSSPPPAIRCSGRNAVCKWSTPITPTPVKSSCRKNKRALTAKMAAFQRPSSCSLQYPNLVLLDCSSRQPSSVPTLPSLPQLALCRSSPPTSLTTKPLCLVSAWPFVPCFSRIPSSILDIELGRYRRLPSERYYKRGLKHTHHQHVFKNIMFCRGGDLLDLGGSSHSYHIPGLERR